MTQGLRSATIFSLAADLPRAIVPDGDAHAEFDAAHLVSATERYPVSLQKLSAAGATLALAARLEHGEALALELANGQRIEGRIDWCEHGEAGLIFDDRIDVIGAIARNLASLPAERRNMPRVEVQQAVSIRTGRRTVLARTRNISQGGACLEGKVELAAGETANLTFDGLRPLRGSIRWVRGNLAGVAFDEELSWQTLMPWLRNSQQHLASGGTAPIVQGESLIPDKHAIRLDAPARVREGVRWWNARVCALTAHLVELETRARVAVGTQLWVAMPEIGGGPAAVLEVGHNRILCEFRLPLRPSELGMFSGRPAS
ncbi:PilZ domain-containing protein [Sphingomonas sp. MMS12-HWE2-04]|uniref:PilZ domain-containing protein n=1 Tax=Sphingomonas sp. MMS12-HWE2-04 TaxID=3234199 RepID=UPI00384E316F